MECTSIRFGLRLGLVLSYLHRCIPGKRECGVYYILRVSYIYACICMKKFGMYVDLTLGYGLEEVSHICSHASPVNVYMV